MREKLTEANSANSYTKANMLEISVKCQRLEPGDVYV